ncbi:MAG: TerB family tellurite resistance protein [Hyphomonadaceae bacterium]
MSDNTLLTAAARAFAVVCYSDGRLAPAEQQRFAAHLRSDPAFRSLDDGAIETAWTEAFRTVSETGSYDSLLPAIAAAGAADREAVMRAAQAALVADETIAPQEEGALAAIAKALGLDPSAY